MLLLLLTFLPLLSLLTSCCFKNTSIRTQAKKKYKPGHIPVFEDPEKPENSTQYDMKTERFFPKKGEENPFEEDCKEKTERTQKDNLMQMQPSSGGTDDKLSAAAAKTAAGPTSPAVQSTQPSVPSPDGPK